MDQGIYTAAAGAIAMEEKLSVTSNNLANINTVGFKKDDISIEKFAKILDTSALSPGQYKNTPIDVIIGRSYVDATQGPCLKTGNPLDIAIIGDGFFVVNTEDGLKYTRAGSFQLNEEGLLVTPEGLAVQGEGGDITLGSGNIEIDRKGNVIFNGNNVDVLQIVNIPQEDLVRAGNGIFDVKQGGTPESVESPNITQGSIEASNVEPVKEMIGLITIQRAYESFQKVIRSINDAYSLSMHNVGTLV